MHAEMAGEHEGALLARVRASPERCRSATAVGNTTPDVLAGDSCEYENGMAAPDAFGAWPSPRGCAEGHGDCAVWRAGRQPEVLTARAPAIPWCVPGLTP